MKTIHRLSSLTWLLFIVILLSFGCKSKKKAMEASNAEKERARIEQEARRQEDEARKRVEEENARKAEEARKNEMKTSTPKARLSEYFGAISSSTNVTATNSTINEALTMFASPDTPVLIIISESGGIKDYDRPTTIKNYLNYLKDQKKNMNAISDIKMDDSGKITELELRKN